jgi:DNA-binding transcriptional LysR family regulator
MLDRLKAALALAATLDFHKAAQRLQISQPRLTRMIKSLEQDLGIILFERGPHGVLLTADGARALKEAANLINAEAKFSQKIEVLRSSGKETLRIAAGAFVAQSWVGAAVTAMKTGGAAISISLRELDWWKLAEAVKSGEVDLAIGELSEANKIPELANEPFPKREGIFIVRADHQLAALKQVTIEEVARFPLVGPLLPGRIAQLLPPVCGFGALSEDGRRFIPVIECATPRSMIDMVSASDAVCMIWPEYCSEGLQSGALREVAFHPPWLVANHGIIYRRTQPLSSAAVAFCAEARRAEQAYFRHRSA